MLGVEGGIAVITPEQFKNAAWRLSNLYHVINADGRDVLFQPNEVQRPVLRDMWFRNVILKSRKRGLSTLIGVLALDTAMSEANSNCQMISDTMVHAEELFRRVIKYAYDHLPDEVKGAFPIASQTQRQIVFENGSVIQVGTSSVGTTPTFLHISELGKIAHDTPDRANEILTGSIQAVASSGNQMVFVESTAWGKTGMYKEMVDRARKLQDSGRSLSKLDLKFLFYPWYMGADNRVFDSEQPISTEMEEYFAKLPTTLDLAQKKWYCTQHEILGPDMLIQHPSTPDEPFSVAIEGAYFAHQFRKVYRDKRIGKFPVDPGLPVHTSWDIGMHDYMAIWFWQIMGGFAVAVDYYESSGFGLPHYAEKLDQRGYRYGTHYAPHDINVREVGTGKTRIEQALELGLRFKIVPKCAVKMDAIEAARRLLDRVKFNEPLCGDAIAHLEAYRKRWNPLANGWSDDPADTGDQHAADAFMTFAQSDDFSFEREAVLTGKVESEWSKGRW